jgi:hypothetical protein
MKLAELAKKAKALPDLDYKWPGPEHFSNYNFDAATSSPEKLREYINELRGSMAKMSMAIHDLTEGYKKMRDLMLEAEVS